MKRFAVKIWHLIERTPPFLSVALSRRGIFCADGRQLIWGKLRRFTFSLYPPVAIYLQRKYGMQGGCVSCGASCKMLFQCPHWDESTHLCSVYEDRPNICRTFPITPGDIRDRDLVLRDKKCGYTFGKKLT